jgi:uncharacterized protein YndB with AHSA1/START domain
MDPAQHGDPRALIVRRVLSASRQAVFDAWTTAKSVRHWMCPEAVSVALAELDVRVGGAFRVDMLVDGEHSVHTGIYREVRPPEKLIFTWRSRQTQHRDTLVIVELRALGDKTELTLTQTLLPDEEAVRKHIRGWTQIIEHLAAYLEPR